VPGGRAPVVEPHEPDGGEEAEDGPDRVEEAPYRAALRDAGVDDRLFEDFVAWVIFGRS
jgi:hypothetical protein